MGEEGVPLCAIVLAKHAAVSITGQTGHSDEIHSPEAWTSVVVSRNSQSHDRSLRFRAGRGKLAKADPLIIRDERYVIGPFIRNRSKDLCRCTLWELARGRIPVEHRTLPLVFLEQPAYSKKQVSSPPSKDLTAPDFDRRSPRAHGGGRFRGRASEAPALQQAP
jgi:hypothetical protein